MGSGSMSVEEQAEGTIMGQVAQSRIPWSDNNYLLFFLNEKTNVGKSQTQIHHQMRRDETELKAGRDLTVIGHGDVKWLVSKYKLASHAIAVQKAVYWNNAGAPVDTYEIKFCPACLVDLALQHLDRGSYELKRPFRLLRAENPAGHAAALAEADAAPDIQIHYLLYAVAERLGYDALRESAFNQLCSSFKAGVKLSDFVTVSLDAFGKVKVIEDQDRRVRAVLATYGAMIHKSCVEKGLMEYVNLFGRAPEYGAWFAHAQMDLVRYKTNAPDRVKQQLDML